MRSFAALATVSLLALASALPEPMVKRDAGDCMTQAEAQKVADNFQELIAAYTLAGTNSYLTADFNDFSDSVTSLIDAGCTGPQNVSFRLFKPGRDINTNTLPSSVMLPSPHVPSSRLPRARSPQSPSSN